MAKMGMDTGPVVNVRFKICKGGSTDWVGFILGARAIDCAERGGLGFVPTEHCHTFSALGISMERTEDAGDAKPDNCYAIKCSAIDSDDESDGGQPSGPTGTDGENCLTLTGGVNREDLLSSVFSADLLYEGDPVTLEKGHGAWVPVVVAQSSDVQTDRTHVVLPADESVVEALPGIWPNGDRQGIVCVMGVEEFDTTLEPGQKVAEIHAAVIQTRVCQECGCMDTDAWIETPSTAKCDKCGTAKVGGPSLCRQCFAPADDCCVLSYAGCTDCRPERLLKGRIRKGPAAGLLARSAMAFAAFSIAMSNTGAPSESTDPSRGQARCGSVDVKEHPAFHIVEEPGGIRYLT